MKVLRTWSGHVLFIGVILTLVLAVHVVGVAGGSMEPNFHEGDKIMVDTLGYKLTGLSRGDVIVFTDPHDTKVVEMKRVIGLPNETVEMNADGVTIRTKSGVYSLYAEGTLIGGAANGSDFTMVLGKEDYFVLGDNRSKSSDSRSFGAVQPVNIIGRVLMRL